MAKPTKKALRPPAAKRTYLKQSEVPSASLEEALRVPQAILDHYAGKPSALLQVAKALNMDPKGSQVRVLSGAAIAFGLIEGGAQATSISVTDLARRILRPKQDNEDIAAKREAVLKPRVFGDFLRQYDGHAFPRKDIALNVIEAMGVPREKAEEVLDRIDASALCRVSRGDKGKELCNPSGSRTRYGADGDNSRGRRSTRLRRDSFSRNSTNHCSPSNSATERGCAHCCNS
jgi:hypothetical protein